MKVFSVFSSLGVMDEGLKKIGCEIVAINEIDKKFFDFSMKKHSPKYGFNCDIRDLVYGKEEIPEELFGIDILAGSPPCTLFSTANLKAEENKGKPKKFKEGQKEQVLDDLVKVYADLIIKIKPKYFIFENVKGILAEKNKPYFAEFLKIIKNEYDFWFDCLNSWDFGSVQKRERAFIFGIRKDLLKIPVDFFVPKKVKGKVFGDIRDFSDKQEKEKIGKIYTFWGGIRKNENGFQESYERATGKKGYFNIKIADNNRSLRTLLTSKLPFLRDIYRNLNKKEMCRAFGLEDDFLDEFKGHHSILGYCVPVEFMIAFKQFIEYSKGGIL